MAKWKNIIDNYVIEDIGGFLLKLIADGMYTEETVIREYVQNARDSYFIEGINYEQKNITITIEKKSIVITDFGVGMDKDDIKLAKKIAVSKKSKIKQLAGYKGIGIWAGLAVCDKLIIESTKKDIDKKFKLEIDFKNIKKSLEKGLDIAKLLDPNYKISEND